MENASFIGKAQTHQDLHLGVINLVFLEESWFADIYDHDGKCNVDWQSLNKKTKYLS